MRTCFLALFSLGLLFVACSDAGSEPGSDPASASGAGGGGASSGSGGAGAGGGGASGESGGGQGGSGAGKGGSDAGQGGDGAGQAGSGGEGGAGAGASGEGGQGGEPFGGAGGTGGSAGSGGGSAGSGGSSGNGSGGSPFGGSAGQGGAGTGGAGGSAAGSGGSSAGSGGSGAVPGWTCGEATYKSGGSYPACNCDCGAYDPDCDDPFSHVKGCGKGQTCSKVGKCEGEIAVVPSSWVCGSAYYAIGGPKPVCNCGCGAPDPDCDLPFPTYDLTKCKKGQTCGEDGTCQGPELAVPPTWTCNPSKFAEGKTSGTCDCDCGAYDPDCNDIHLKLTGCGYKQTCDASGKCMGEIAPAPAGWTCASNTYSDGKLCHCEVCGIRDPDCDMGFPDDCGPDAFCGSIKNECIPKAQ